MRTVDDRRLALPRQQPQIDPVSIFRPELRRIRGELIAELKPTPAGASGLGGKLWIFR